jgi:hypothetical protein
MILIMQMFFDFLTKQHAHLRRNPVGTNLTLDQLPVGVVVQLMHRNKLIDKMRVTGTKRYPKGREEIEAQSLEFDPDSNPDTFTRFSVEGGWKLVFTDRMTGAPCISRRAPTYRFRLAIVPAPKKKGETYAD